MTEMNDELPLADLPAPSPQAKPKKARAPKKPALTGEKARPTRTRKKQPVSETLEPIAEPASGADIQENKVELDGVSEPMSKPADPTTPSETEEWRPSGSRRGGGRDSQKEMEPILPVTTVESGPKPEPTIPAPKEEISTAEMLRRLHANDPRPRRTEAQHSGHRQDFSEGEGKQNFQSNSSQPSSSEVRPQEIVYGEGIIEVSRQVFGFGP